jgi:hypothetical protein
MSQNWLDPQALKSYVHSHDPSPLPVRRTRRGRSTIVTVAVVALAVAFVVGFRYVTRGDVSVKVTSCNETYGQEYLPGGVTGRVNVPAVIPNGTAVGVRLRNNTGRYVQVDLQDGHGNSLPHGGAALVILGPHETRQLGYSGPCDHLKAVTTTATSQ